SIVVRCIMPWDSRLGSHGAVRRSAGPGARGARKAGRTGAVDDRLDQTEDCALQRGRGEYLRPTATLVGRVGCLLFMRHELPDPLEEQAREHATDDTDDESDGLVQRLAHDHSRAHMRPRTRPTTSAPATMNGTGRSFTMSARTD